MTALGLLAGALTTGCWLPQLLRSWQTRSTEDFSWVYLALLLSGVGLWLTYGLVSGDLAITVANALTLLAILAILAIVGLKTQTDTSTAEEMVAEPSTVTPS